MDEKYIETGEKTQESLKVETLARISAQAFSTENLAPHQFVAYNCTECDDELPLLRMQKGFTLCTLDQTEQERRKTRRG